jgi:hypothetical protein
MSRFFILLWVVGITQVLGQTANLCEPLIRHYEMAHGIPHKLLTAISVVESGRKMGGAMVAWPWTINANGRPYIFATKEEAVAMVRKLQGRGITSIDVGCMQINLKQHPHAFTTLENAFDPATNIAYAARFLKAKRNHQGTWKNAVGHYHSARKEYNSLYIAKVLKVWGRMQANPQMMQSLYQNNHRRAARYEGKFIDVVSTPSGRRVPMMIRFAPYKGFNDGITTVVPQNSMTARIIRGWPSRPKAKPRKGGSNEGLHQVLGSALLGKVIYTSLKPRASAKPIVKSQ